MGTHNKGDGPSDIWESIQQGHDIGAEDIVKSAGGHNSMSVSLESETLYFSHGSIQRRINMDQADAPRRPQEAKDERTQTNKSEPEPVD